MSLSGAFLNALSNVMLEYWLTNQSDIYHYLGFLGLFGTTISFSEAAIFGKFEKIRTQIQTKEEANFLIVNLMGFAIVNFVCYLVIPIFVRRSGATLLNISNVTTVIWSLLTDTLLLNKPFYYLYIIAFLFEISGVVVFSLKKPK